MLLVLVVQVALVRLALSDQRMILTGAEIDTLVALVERGPLTDGDLPSKVGRDCLLTGRLAAQVVINTELKYAATNIGLEWYLQRFKANNIQDGRTNRLIARQLP